MNKILFAFLCLFVFSAAHAQTYTSGHLTVIGSDSLSHDSTSCKISISSSLIITVDSSYTGEVLNVVDTLYGTLLYTTVNTSGVSPWSVTAPLDVYGASDNQIYGGYFYYYSSLDRKVTCGADTVLGILLADSLLVTNGCLWSSVSGTIYADNNGNCVFDSGDIGVNLITPDVNVYFVAPGTGWFSTAGTFGAGYYYASVEQSWMSNYTVSLPSYLSFIFPGSACFSGSYTFTTLPESGANFPLQCTSNVDVQTYALSSASIRLHRSFFMEPYVSNTGCDSVSGQLNFVLDSHVVYDSALSSHPADMVHGDTLIWNYNGLSSLAGGAYWNSFFSDVYLSLDSTVVVGDTMCFRVYTNIPAADVNPANNDYTVCLPVVYSFDPNVKEVSPKGDGPQGYIQPGADTLTYNLHFQNTGSDVAEDIVVIDTLDSHINAASLKILGTSHNMMPQWLTPNVVQFNFNEINLPDSGTNFAASQGEVRFSVALNSGLTPGTPIKNTGYIYFDLNPPVVTNTTLNTIAEPNKINPVTANTTVKVYPNPATDHIVVENLDGGELSIIGMNGAVVMKQNIKGDKALVDVNELPGGIYMLKAVKSTTTTTIKFTKY